LTNDLILRPKKWPFLRKKIKKLGLSWSQRPRLSDDVWTAELAVGSEKFVNHVRRQSGYAPVVKPESNVLVEEPGRYGDQRDCGNMVEWGF